MPSWEGQQQWQSSINEYQLAGEGAPTSENITRVYNEWGEQINAQHRYENALAKFNIVLTNYGSASTGVARAQSDTVKAYLAWGQQASLQQDYTSATSHFDALLQLSYCTATCQSQANSLDATAYYNLAESKLWRCRQLLPNRGYTLLHLARSTKAAPGLRESIVWAWSATA